MERKGRTIRRQRRSRSWLFSPMIIAQLAVVMVIAGVGVSYALTDTEVNITTAPWAGYASVDDGVIKVNNYELVFSTDLASVIGVKLYLENTDGSNAHGGTAQVAFGASIVGSQTITSFTGTTSVTVSIGTVAIGSIGSSMRILVTTP